MQQIEVCGITVEVVRKKIKHLNLVVYPPDGRVRISVPLEVGDEAVRAAVASKLDWIQRQQVRINAQPRRKPSGGGRPDGGGQPSGRAYLSGETVYFMGEPHKLRVVPHDGGGHVLVRGKTIDLYARPDSTVEQRRRTLVAWYRSTLSLPLLVSKWEPVLGVKVAEWGIRQMKTRWGSCSVRARRIWVNLDLAKLPPRFLEYIVVHEMLHLIERRHNAHFKALMTRFLPAWQSLRDELKHYSLTHAEWGD